MPLVLPIFGQAGCFVGQDLVMQQKSTSARSYPHTADSVCEERVLGGPGAEGTPTEGLPPN